MARDVLSFGTGGEGIELARPGWAIWQRRRRTFLSTRRLTAGVLAALMTVAVLAAVLAGGSSAKPTAAFKAALISDVGHFNDKSFNQSQLAGLNLAKKKLKVQTLAIQS